MKKRLAAIILMSLSSIAVLSGCGVQGGVFDMELIVDDGDGTCATGCAPDKVCFGGKCVDRGSVTKCGGVYCSPDQDCDYSINQCRDKPGSNDCTLDCDNGFECNGTKDACICNGSIQYCGDKFQCIGAGKECVGGKVKNAVECKDNEIRINDQCVEKGGECEDLKDTKCAADELCYFVEGKEKDKGVCVKTAILEEKTKNACVLEPSFTMEEYLRYPDVWAMVQPAVIKNPKTGDVLIGVPVVPSLDKKIPGRGSAEVQTAHLVEDGLIDSGSFVIMKGNSINDKGKLDVTKFKSFKHSIPYFRDRAAIAPNYAPAAAVINDKPVFFAMTTAFRQANMLPDVTDMDIPVTGVGAFEVTDSGLRQRWFRPSADWRDQVSNLGDSSLKARFNLYRVHFMQRVGRSGALVVADLGNDGRVQLIVGGLIIDAVSGDLVGMIEYESWTGHSSKSIKELEQKPSRVVIPMVAELNNDNCAEIIESGRVYQCEKKGDFFRYKLAKDSPAHIETLSPKYSSPMSAVVNLGMGDDAEPALVVCGNSEAKLYPIKVENPGNRIVVDNPSSAISLDDKDDGGGMPTIGNFIEDGKLSAVCAYKSQVVIFSLDKESSPPVIKQVNKKPVNIAGSFGVSGVVGFDFNGDKQLDFSVDTQQDTLIGDIKSTTEIDTELVSNRSFGLVDSPVVADVNQDGHANIITVSSYGVYLGDRSKGDDINQGIRVWKEKHNLWYNTSTNFNQFAYDRNNLNDDGILASSVGWKKNQFRVQEANKQVLFHGADLEITEFSFEENGCAFPSSSSDFTLRVRVTNKGGVEVAKGALEVRFLDSMKGKPGIKPDGQLIVGCESKYNTEAIKPGESIILTCKVIKAAASQYSVEVDSDDLIAECNVDNNYIAYEDLLDVPPTPKNRPDLTVNDVSASCTGGKLKATVKVKNVGKKEATDVSVALYGKVEGTSSYTLLGRTTIPGDFNKDETKDIEFDINDIRHVKLKLKAVVDDDYKFVECAESNNEFVLTSPVQCD